MNRDIAYLSHVQWGGIKQRPQMLAEQLGKDFKVFYIENRGASAFLRKVSITKYLTSSNIVFKRVPWLNPFKISNRVLRYLAQCFNGLSQCMVKRMLNSNYIWVTHPIMYEEYKKHIPTHTKIIYDCMDDALEFNSPYPSKESLLQMEKELVGRSTAVICSADHLRQKMLSRHSIINKCVVINNAIEIPSSQGLLPLPDNIQAILNDISKIPYPLIYVGTVSSWFDFNTMETILKRHEQLTLVIVGPCEVDIPKHNRIIAYGAVDRQYIFQIMSYAFALVMPFQVNELIKSVNPVKLYEYIYTGKPSIAPRYGETEKFSEFVYLYNDTEELLLILNRLLEKAMPKQEIGQCFRFAEKNTWNSRYQQIKLLLKNEDALQ